MLKIKDDVDLYELEKFGFEISEDEACKYYRYTTIKVISQTREIIIRLYGIPEWVKGELTAIYDLIQAGLVEKVGGEH